MLARSPHSDVASPGVNVGFPLCHDPAHEPPIRRLLVRCVDFLRSRLPGPRLCAIILTGSFARGEGSVVPVGGRLRVLGDLEFLVAVTPNTDVRSMRANMAAWSREASIALGDEVQAEIEFGPVELGYFARRVRPAIFVYDLLTHGKVIWGPPDIMDTLPTFSAADIPRDDCLALLFNRTIEQLEAYDRVPGAESDPFTDAVYQRSKLMLDIAGSALAFSGRHVPSYAERPAEFARLAVETPALRDLLPEGFQDDLESAARTKLSPATEIAARRVAGTPRERQAWIRSQIVAGIPAVAAVIRWELEELLGQPMDLPELLAAYLAAQPWSERARDWAKIALHPMPAPLPLSLNGVARQFFAGTPRALLYAAGTLAYLDLAGIRLRRAALAPLLFVRGGTVSDDPEGQRKAITALWRWCVRNN
jgi:hypothetical protein